MFPPRKTFFQILLSHRRTRTSAPESVSASASALLRKTDSRAFAFVSSVPVFLRRSSLLQPKKTLFRRLNEMARKDENGERERKKDRMRKDEEREKVERKRTRDDKRRVRMEEKEEARDCRL